MVSIDWCIQLAYTTSVNTTENSSLVTVVAAWLAYRPGWQFLTYPLGIINLATTLSR